MPQAGELWRLRDGHLARVHLVTVTCDRRLAFAFVTTRMAKRNVPLAEFFPPAHPCGQAAMW